MLRLMYAVKRGNEVVSVHRDSHDADYELSELYESAAGLAADAELMPPNPAAFQVVSVLVCELTPQDEMEIRQWVGKEEAGVASPKPRRRQ